MRLEGLIPIVIALLIARPTQAIDDSQSSYASNDDLSVLCCALKYLIIGPALVRIGRRRDIPMSSCDQIWILPPPRVQGLAGYVRTCSVYSSSLNCR